MEPVLLLAPEDLTDCFLTMFWNVDISGPLTPEHDKSSTLGVEMNRILPPTVSPGFAPCLA